MSVLLRIFFSSQLNNQQSTIVIFDKYRFHLSFRTSVPLKGFDKHGRRVLILNGSKVNPSKHSMTDQFKANLMVNELLMKDCNDVQVTR